ncbi:MAG: serine--tRNA ligase, partial [Anaerolineae bacterium]|nr:serine--tRNA ligase [Anaerolineae bacterium]
MIDLKLIREHPDLVRQAVARLNTSAPIDEILALDAKRRDLLQQVEGLKAQRNVASREIPRLKDEAERQARIDEMRSIGEEISRLDQDVRAVQERLDLLLLEVPNLPHPDVPVGKDESENVVVRTVGQPRRFDFEPLPHWELGTSLGIIDFERGVKISGSRFYVLKGDG